MGMTIDNSCEPKPMSKEEIVETLKAMVFGVQAFERFNAKERETLDKACSIIDQYEARLKADMVAMLEDLKKEMNPIKECEYQIYGKEHWGFVGKCQDIIQEEINVLKENEDEQKQNS